MRLRSRYIGLAAVSLIAAFAVLEALSRWIAPSGSDFERRYPVGILRAPEPYAMFGGVPSAWLAGAEHLNAQGYRGKGATGVRGAGEYRAFLLGGSALFMGDRPLPALVEDELHRRGLSEVTCFNYGVVSSVSGMELARLVFEVSSLKPDLVVFYDGGNDLTIPAVYDPRPGYPFNFLVYESNPLLMHDPDAFPGLALVAYRSNLLRMLFPGWFERRFVDLAGLRRRVGYGGEDWREAIARTYVSHLVMARKVARATGAEFIAFFQPLLYFKPHLGTEETLIATQSDLKPLALDLRARVRRHFARAREEEGIEVVDLSDIYDDTPGDVFKDVVHVNAEGNLTLARAVAGSMAEVVHRTEAGRGGGTRVPAVRPF